MRIVVVGGGYGGLRLIERLAPAFNGAITLVDKNPYHYLQTEAYEFLSGRKNICDITFSLHSFCSHFDNVTFIQDEAIGIDGRRLICKNQEIAFDKLVIATGAKDFFPTESIEQKSYAIKDLSSAFVFKQRFLKELFDEVAAKKGATIVVGGGGLSGVELAADFADVMRRCSSEVGECALSRVILLEATDTLLPGSSSYLQEETLKRLQELCVDVRLKTMIEDVDDRYIHTKSEKIAYDLFIFSGGIRASSFVANLPYEKNRLGQLVVDERLMVDEEIFAIGDAAQIKAFDGSILPPTAQVAEQCGEFVANYLLGKETRFKGKIYGIFVALGKGYAVGELFGVRLKGRIAAWMKEAITRLYAFGIKIKVNSGFKKRL